MAESVGQQLRKKREARRITLEQASQATHIRLRYLRALEADDFTILPSTVQVRGFLRSYAQLLDLPVDKLLGELDGVPVVKEAQPDEKVSQPEVEPALTHIETSNSDTIFQEIGAQMRRQRELLGLTLEDIERNTHLRMRYLKALESGRLDDLPSPVQGRGMLSNYAAFLGLDTDAVLLRFAEGLQTRLADRQAATRPSEKSRPGISVSRQQARRRQMLAPDFIFGFVAVTFLVGFIVWAALRVSSVSSEQEPTLTAPSVAEVLAQDSPTPSATTELGLEPAGDGLAEESVSEATSTLAAAIVEPVETLAPTPTFPVAESGVIQLYLVARQRAWVRVIVDGSVELEDRVAPGSPYLFTGNERIELLTGNGAALQVFLNRQDLGPLGINGEVVQRVFTLTGMQTPTT